MDMGIDDRGKKTAGAALRGDLPRFSVFRIRVKWNFAGGNGIIKLQACRFRTGQTDARKGGRLYDHATV